MFRLDYDQDELNTLIAALRWWQRTGNVPGSPERDLATEGEELGDEAIDALCERINFAEDLGRRDPPAMPHVATCDVVDCARCATYYRSVSLGVAMREQKGGSHA